MSPEFERRLAAARHRVRTVPDPPVQLKDQIAAASADNASRLDSWAAVMEAKTGAVTKDMRDTAPTPPEVSAYLLAALTGITYRCPHLASPAPAVLNLPFHRLHCFSCYPTAPPPPDEDDRCDLCEARGVTWFQPIAMLVGPVTMVGNLCPACTEVFDIG